MKLLLDGISTNTQYAIRNTCLRSGQVMILTVLMLGATMIGATTIAGLLMLYQVRQASDIINSTKAVYAADAGVDAALYQYFKQAQGTEPTFTNGAALQYLGCVDTLQDNTHVEVDCSADFTDSEANPFKSRAFKAVGRSAGAYRSLAQFLGEHLDPEN